MCLAIPGYVTAIEANTAIVEFGGVTQRIAIDLLPDLIVGQYILAHAGFAIQVIDPKDAEELRQVFDELKELVNSHRNNDS